MRRLGDSGTGGLRCLRIGPPIVRSSLVPKSPRPHTCGEATTTLMHPPSLKDVYAARPRVARIVRPSPLLRHPLLALETGLDIWVKHENHNPTGAFKVRGGANLVASLSADERRG